MNLINGINLRSGGGLTILKQAYAHAPKNSVFLVGNSSVELLLRQSRIDGPQIVVISRILKFFIFYFYFYWVDQYAKKNGVSKILSLGNIAARTDIPQVLYLHWSYFISGFASEGDANLRTKIKRRIRYVLIRFFFRYPDTIVVQTKKLQQDLLEKAFVKSKRIRQIYPGRTKCIQKKDYYRGGRMRLFYPALYYSHKNFELLLDVCKQLEKKKVDFTLTLTLPNSDFECLGFGQCNNVVNIGVLSYEKILEEYLVQDALLMPTKFETFGLPYLEALSMGLPILTSDKPFSKEICGAAALYFDCESVSDIVRAIESIHNNPVLCHRLKSKSDVELRKFPSWEKSIKYLFNAQEL